MKFARIPIRSVQGQLGLLALTYAGGVMLAVLALCLRDIFFEKYIREKYPPLGEASGALVTRLAAGRGSVEDLDKLAEEQAKQRAGEFPVERVYPQVQNELMDAVYGAWIEDPERDPDGNLARRLLSAKAEFIIARIRRTLAAGSPGQRLRAVEWLALGPPKDHETEWLDLALWARARSQRRGETELANRAGAVVHQLEGRAPRPP
jgi:hypothetical protein